jgi:hypothetical protein
LNIEVPPREKSALNGRGADRNPQNQKIVTRIAKNDRSASF